MIDLPSYAAPRGPLRRMIAASFGQEKHTPRRPETPRLDGTLAVVTGAIGGMKAYCRSKLGNLWISAELVNRLPALEVRVVHPGVVATNLGGDAGAAGHWFKRRVMISPEQGAQMPLICATQAGLASGGYWHNVHGRMQLATDDPARDSVAAAKLWETCEALGSV